MALTVECPECFQIYTVPANLEGKKIKCKSCSSPILVQKPETLTRQPPRSSGSSSAPPKRSSGTRPKRRVRLNSGSRFSLSSIDSPMGYLIILLIIFGLWFMNMPTGKDSAAANGLLAIIVLVLASRAKYLVRRGEGSPAFHVMMVLITIGFFGFIYKIGQDIRAARQQAAQNSQAAQSPDTEASSQTPYQAVSDETLYVVITDDLVLLPGTTLFLNERGKLVDLTVLEESVSGQPVKVQRNDRPDTELTYNREEIWIGEKLRQRLWKEGVAAAKAAQEAEEQARELLDLVSIPEDVLGLRDLEEVYVKGWGKWLLVQPQSRKGGPRALWTVKYLEGPLTGKNGEYELNRLHVRRELLPSLERRPTVVENQPAPKDSETPVVSVLPDNLELLPGTPCRWITPEGAVNARVVEQLSNDQIRIEHFSRSGAETELVKRAELSVPEAWQKYLATGGRNAALRPPLEKQPWFAIPTPPARIRSTAFLDLTEKFNRNLYQPFGTSPLNVLQDLDPGYYNFGGVDFYIAGKAIQLNSRSVSNYKEYVGIPVDRKVNSFEILHSTMYGGYPQSGHRFHVDDGTVVGEFGLEYESGDTETVPIVYGENVREWWSWEPSETSDADLVWTGDNAEAQKYKLRLRFYKYTLKNPRPDEKIGYLFYKSSMSTAVAPFCVAISVVE